MFPAACDDTISESVVSLTGSPPPGGSQHSRYDTYTSRYILVIVPRPMDFRTPRESIPAESRNHITLFRVVFMAPGPASSTRARSSPPLSKSQARSSGQSDNIYEAALKCRTAFEEYLKTPRLCSKQVEEFQRRFISWAGFLGVFAAPSVCLDTRLANAPEVKDLFVSMLRVLHKSLESGMPSPI